MASDDHTIHVELSGAAAEPAPPTAPTLAATDILPAPSNDLDALTPAIGIPPGTTALEKTILHTEVEPPNVLIRGTVDLERTCALQAPIVAPPGETAPSVPGYLPIKKLGEGTFGKVWLFEAEHSGKRVAIKFFVHGATQQWQLLQAEIMQLARLYGDPGIVQLQDLEPDAIPPYCILTYAEGGSIADRLKLGPMPVAEALEVFHDAAKALAYVHAKGIIHCDLKPGNVLRDARGRTLLADFGQAHLASDLTPALGTFFYMAPEQADLAASIPDTRWDVYALGALFYAMVTGRPPRENPSLRHLIGTTPTLPDRLQLYRESVRSIATPREYRSLPGMDRRLTQLIDQCLEPDPAKRIRDGGAVVEALNRRARARRQRPVFLFGLLAPLLLLLVAAGAAIVMGRSALSDAEEALVKRQLKDNQVLARLAANSLEPKLDYRLGLLEKFAKEDRKLRQALTPLPTEEKPVYQERVAAFRKILDDQKPEDRDPDWLFFDLFVADRDGYIVAENPPDPKVHRSERWDWRDWFNGRGDKHVRGANEHFAISPAKHVSQPYVFRGNTTNVSNLLVIALSVPVLDPKGETVVGRLVGLVKIEQLNSQIDEIGLREENGCIVLVNERGLLIYHGLHNQKLPELMPRHQDPIALAADKYIIQPLDSGDASDASTGQYTDPLDDKVYLAASVTMKNHGWRILVQSERKATLQPSRDLAHWMRAVGLAAFIAAVLLILGLYVLLRKTMQRGENAAHA